jgi:hypothetical protein
MQNRVLFVVFADGRAGKDRAHAVGFADEWDDEDIAGAAGCTDIDGDAGFADEHGDGERFSRDEEFPYPVCFVA